MTGRSSAFLVAPAEALPPVGARDALTGLADRVLLRRRLAAAAAAGRGLTLIFLDLDNFKAVNDGCGHAAGDALLVEVARRLDEAVRDGDAVARLGGDEFAVLGPQITTADGARALAERICEALRAPFDVGGRELHPTASVGCRTLGPGPAPEADSLLGDADAAMYEAKEAGRDRVSLFAAGTRARLVRRLDLADELRRALDRGELSLHLHPHVELATGRIVGAEALLRWTHPRLGRVSPAEFVPVAEQFGLVGAIGTWVLREAAELLARWRDEGRELTLSVNVSGAQLRAGGFAEVVEGIIHEFGIEPSALCLEITESTLMGSTGEAIDALRRLRDGGHYIAIDDFGTGYSSLAYLKELPVEILKIDRGFVGGLGTDPHDSAIVASIMSLAHAMGLHVIAEGVETPEQAAELRALGCPVGQGYLFARPSTPARFDAYCRDGLPGVPRARRPCVRRGFIDEFMHQIGIPAEAL
jgi:diguanylate cyclase (GGDEF)-like protein